MGSYSVIETAAETASAEVEIAAASAGQYGILSLRLPSEIASSPLTLRLGLAPAGGAATSRTPEEYNSRSPSPQSSATINDAGIPSGRVLVLAILSSSRMDWHGDPRFPYLRQDTESSEVFGISFPTNSYNINFSFYEDTSFPKRPIRTRGTQRGYYFYFGNNSTLHKKTGGGAYETWSPYFEQTAWIQTDDWRNDAQQAQVWNMNLYGGPPEEITADKWHPLSNQPYPYKTEIVNY